MLETHQDTRTSAQQRCGALSRWDNEGGAGPDGPHESHAFDAKRHCFAVRSSVVLFTNNLLSGSLNVRFLSVPNANVRIVAESTQLTRDSLGELVRAIVLREVTD